MYTVLRPWSMAQAAERAHRRFLVVLGRARRLGGVNLGKELGEMLRERKDTSVGADVRKTLGDAATGLVASDLHAGLVVVQAAAAA